MLHCQIVASTTHRAIQKSCIETTNLRYQKQHGMKNLNYLMNLFLHQTFRNISNASSKSMKHLLINHQPKYKSTKFSIELHLRLDPGTLKLLTAETIKLLGSNKRKITKNKNGKNVPQQEITKTV